MDGIGVYERSAGLPLASHLTRSFVDVQLQKEGYDCYCEPDYRHKKDSECVEYVLI
jgi:hypothetical protein